MHVLLIDDCDLKINQLRRFLIGQGIDENDLLIAKDVADASRKLNQYKFDLMLIDVLLPARGGQNHLLIAALTCLDK